MSKRELPPPGQLVDVGGYKLHMQRSGSGSPTVILEAGWFAYSLTWCLVQPKVARLTQVCSYDRAGMGWSDSSPNEERSSIYIAQELRALLKAANIDGPLVLVGWSIGGIYVRKFAYLYPELVAGMVLVDSSHENDGGRVPPDISQAFEEDIRATAEQFRKFAQLTHEQILEEAPLPDSFEHYPTKIKRLILDRRRPRNYEALARIASYTGDFVQGENALKPLGAMPLVVLSANPEPAPFLSDEQNAIATAEARKCQAELAALSSDSRHTWVDTGHAIQIEDPQAVISAIREVVMKVRDQQP